MRTRVETLLGSRTAGDDVDLDVPRAVRPPAAARGAAHRPVARLRHLRLDRSAHGRQAGAEGARDRRQRAQPRQVLSRISHAKNRMEGPESFASAAWNPRDEQIGTVYAMYLAALKDANALDFDDLLLKTVELFEKSETVRNRYSEKFRYVMVDEYQDTNRPQYLLVQRLARPASQPLRRRRSRPVDLQVARRRPAQHPRLRARLSRRCAPSGSSATIARRR